MATRLLLAELAEAIAGVHGVEVRFESAGGVEVARRVREGAAADVLVLAEDAMDSLALEGRVLPATLRPLFVSQVVAAVPVTRPAPALDSERDLREALRGANRIGYSTGPSGTALLDLVGRYGLDDEVAPKLVQAPPGVAVGSLLGPGGLDLAFQQRSELMSLPDVVILGPLPGEAAISSTFTAGVLTASSQPDAARRLVGLLASDQNTATVEAHGMAPVGAG
jgi:molybdate transport system substrate-binding protein